MEKRQGNATKVLKVIILICLVLLVATCIVAGLYLRREWDRTTFFANTTINGFDVTGKTQEEITDMLTDAYSAPSVVVSEKGEPSITGTLADFGYTIDKTALGERVGEAFHRQKTSVLVLLGSLMNGNSFRLSIPFECDEQMFNAKVCSAQLKEPRIASVDSEMLFDEEAKNYYMKPEVYGNEMNDSDLQNLVKEQLDTVAAADDPQPDQSIEIPDTIYIKPAVTQDDAELNNLCNLYNHYDKAQITYLFGQEKEVIDWNTVKNWLIITDGSASLDEGAIREYVRQMTAKYQTVFIDRSFQTSVGTTVTIPAVENEYGYMVDEDAEYAQLIADINANTAVEREPVYYHAGYARNGVDDLAGNYVEINISAQKLWFYKNGECIVNGADIVSGCVAKKTETQTGAFPLAYKESPSVLEGNNAENGWRTEVTYWMPFFDGQGLHDATWRGSFGGNIYLTNGSHGCVNLPFDIAKQIYDNIDEGVAIILYK